MDIPISKELGSQLKKFREEKNLSQDEVAELMGISRTTISKIENGLWNFSVEKLQEYCKVLGVELQLNSSVLDFEPVFEIENGILYHRTEPQFSCSFIRNQDMSYKTDNITLLNTNLTEEQHKIMPKLLRMAGEFYYEYLKKHSPDKN